MLRSHLSATVLAGLLIGAFSSSAKPLFKQAPPSSGFAFVHVNGMSGQKYFHEVMGAGVALVDYDQDGDLDIYLVQGHALAPLREQRRPTDRLFRNVSTGGELRFEDVTEEAGVDVAQGYGMGVATGDIDNDGWVDIYLTNWGANQLLRNLGPDSSGQVRFEEIGVRGGVADGSWSVSASFADVDRDGLLDLYVANYAVFELAIHRPCRNYTGAADYCSPLAYGHAQDRFFKNLGKAAFRDLSRTAGLMAAGGAALGVIALDLNGDNRPDFYVANDQSANQHWINDGSGGFSDEALLAGTAVNAEGRAEAGMGVAAADVDNDGDPDILVSHLDRETNTLYLNDGGGFFDDVTARTGMARATWDATGFGLAFLDIDNDGVLDIAVANGAVKELEALVREEDPFPLHQPNQLFRGLGGGRFDPWTEGGPAFEHSEVSRGLAAGDIDNDGDTDLVVTNNHGPARLLINQVGQDQPWVGFRLLEFGRDAAGATAILKRSDGPALWRRAGSDGSYASASDPRVLFGLGGGAGVQSLEVRWSDGLQETFEITEIRRYQTVTRGEGSARQAKESSSAASSAERGESRR